MKDWKKSKKAEPGTAAGIFFWCLAVVLTAYSLFLCSGSDIWYDELFTEGLIAEGVGDLLRLDARDVHPPLYYLLVKGAVDLAHLFLPDVEAVTISKMMSVLPFFGLLGYGAIWVQKRYGWLSAGLFAFCVVSMPQMSGYTTEVRMYGWALFFVTAAFLHGGEILHEAFHASEGEALKKTEAAGISPGAGAGGSFPGNRTGRSAPSDRNVPVRGGFPAPGHWTAFILSGICAAYTHYFAALAAFFLYLVLAAMLLWGCRGEIRRRNLRLWALGAGISVAAYLPWIPSALSQVMAVRRNYWILPLEWSCFGGCVKFVLKPSTGYQWLDYGAAVFLFALLGGLLSGIFLKWKKMSPGEDGKYLYAACGPVVLGATALSGILISVLMRPIFIYRYMLPAMGIFWLGFVCLLCRRKKKILLIPCLLLLAMGLKDYRAFAGEELFKKKQMERTLAELEGIDNDAAVLFNFDQLQAVAGYYLEQDTWLYDGEPEELIRRVFPRAHGGGDGKWLKSLLEKEGTVWFAGSGLARDALLEEWEQEGIRVAETVDSCLLERYWFNLYRLEME